MKAVRKAYQELVMPHATQQPSSYSTETLFSRAVILKAAADCLLDLELRRAYDERIKQQGPELRVLIDDMPGALALLQVCWQQLYPLAACGCCKRHVGAERRSSCFSCRRLEGMTW